VTIEVFAPERAPARTDLPFLRHRVRPRPAAAQTAPPAAAQAAPPATRSAASRPAPPAAAGSASLDLSAPAPMVAQPAAGSASLDLSAPAPMVAQPAAGSASLDLSAPAPRPAQPVAGSARLDLSTPTATAAPSASARPARPRPARPLPRARSGERTLLTPKAPTVTLTRLQSGIGVLSIEAACSAAVGDLRIGAAYQLADGHSSLVVRAGGITAAPRDSRRPVILARAEQYERLLIDLRQNRQLERLVVFAFSESGAQLNWGGTLVTSTAGAARIELPLERPASAGVMVLLSVYNVHGEFVVRAEMETISGSIRAAVQAYGFDRISWLDDRTPVA
jgi:uncharacterized protein involved in tellurium resistance